MINQGILRFFNIFIKLGLKVKQRPLLHYIGGKI